MSSSKPVLDPFPRGTPSSSSQLGNTLFVILRLLNLPLQYILLTTPLLSHLPFLSLSPPSPTLTPHTTLLLTMSTLNCAKQIHYHLSISPSPLPVSSAVAVSIANYVTDSIFSLLFFLTPATPTSAIIGAVLYPTGLAAEWISELQRRTFKNNPSNKGKPFTGGLFKLARHINLGGYMLARGAFAMTAGGLVAGIVVGGLFMRDFSNRAVKILDEYCSEKYGKAWGEFKNQTRWRLVPGIW